MNRTVRKIPAVGSSPAVSVSSAHAEFQKIPQRNIRQGPKDLPDDDPGSLVINLGARQRNPFFPIPPYPFSILSTIMNFSFDNFVVL